MNDLSTTPAPDAVKRYRVDVRDGVVEDRGDWIWPATTSQPMVLASDYDALARQVEGLRAERDSFFKQTVQAVEERDALKARVEAAKLIFERACPWFQIQEVAYPKLGAKAKSIWESMRRWLAGDPP